MEKFIPIIGHKTLRYVNAQHIEQVHRTEREDADGTWEEWSVADAAGNTLGVID